MIRQRRQPLKFPCLECVDNIAPCIVYSPEWFEQYLENYARGALDTHVFYIEMSGIKLITPLLGHASATGAGLEEAYEQDS